MITPQDKKQIKVFIVSLLILVLLFPILPKPKEAEAQVIGTFPVFYDPTGVTQVGTAVATITGSINGNVVGGVVNDTIVQGIIGQITDKTCKDALNNLDLGKLLEISKNIGKASSFAVIGPNPAELIKLETELKLRRIQRHCVDLVEKGLETISILFVTQGQTVTTLRQKWAEALNNLDLIIKDLETRVSLTGKELLKAIAVRALETAAQGLMTRVTNALLDQYKVSNFLAFGQALSKQIYASDYIIQNYSGDAQTALLVKAAFDNRYSGVANAASTFDALVSQKAQQNLGFDPVDLNPASQSYDPNDPNWYYKLAQINAADNQRLGVGINVMNAADQAYSASQAAANQEVATGNGGLANRTCDISKYAAQQQIDNQVQQASAEVNAIIKARAGLTDPEEIKKAEADLAAAQARLNAITDIPTEDGAVYEVCTAINAPASYIQLNISNYIQQLFKSSTDFKSENLPFFASFLSSVANGLINNLITGGKSNGSVFNETGLSGITPATNSVDTTSDTSGLESGDNGTGINPATGSSPYDNTDTTPPTTPPGGGGDTTATCPPVVSNGIGIACGDPSPQSVGAEFTLIVSVLSGGPGTLTLEELPNGSSVSDTVQFSFDASQNTQTLQVSLPAAYTIYRATFLTESGETFTADLAITIPSGAVQGVFTSIPSGPPPLVIDPRGSPVKIR